MLVVYLMQFSFYIQAWDQQWKNVKDLNILAIILQLQNVKDKQIAERYIFQ